MLYPVIINKFQRAPQNEFDFGRKSRVAGPRQCQEQRQTQANKPKTKQKNKKQKQKQNETTTSWKQQIDVTRSSLLSHSQSRARWSQHRRRLSRVATFFRFFVASVTSVSGSKTGLSRSWAELTNRRRRKPTPKYQKGKSCAENTMDGNTFGMEGNSFLSHLINFCSL